MSKIGQLTPICNSNGKTQGITLPSAQGQEAVIRKAYRKAGLSENFSETDYIECHGTGTPVGDPIELEAVSRVFAAHRQERLLVGSVSRTFILSLIFAGSRSYQILSDHISIEPALTGLMPPGENQSWSQ